MNLVNGVHPFQQKRDRWRWFIDETEEFKVKTLRELVDEKTLEGQGTVLVTKWNRWIPKKINVFVWRLRQRRIPTRMVLDHMGIDLDSILCPCCQDAIETVEHCLIRCKWAEDGWVKIFKWWNLNVSFGTSILDLISHEGHQSFTMNHKILWQAVIWCSTYVIWEGRNNVTFYGKKTNYLDLCAEVQVLVFFGSRIELRRLIFHWKNDVLL